jgi:predicted transcriptional regulator
MYIKKNNIRIIKKSSIMKRELKIDMNVVKKHNASVAVVLAVIKNADGVMTVTEVSKAVGITYPTAHKFLDMLVAENYIEAVDQSSYRKI